MYGSSPPATAPALIRGIVELQHVLAVLAGAEAFTDMARFGERKIELLRRFRPYVNGTLSHDHLGDIFATLDPRAEGEKDAPPRGGDCSGERRGGLSGWPNVQNTPINKNTLLSSRTAGATNRYYMAIQGPQS
jgi:hypothetical protein